MPLPPSAALVGDSLRISRVALPGALACRGVMSAASLARIGFAAAGAAFAGGLPGSDVDVTTSAAAAAAAAKAAALTPTVRRLTHQVRRRGCVSGTASAAIAARSVALA